MATYYRYREEVRGLRILETVKIDLSETANPRAKAFWLLSYARLTDEARAYLKQYVAEG